MSRIADRLAAERYLLELQGRNLRLQQAAREGRPKPQDWAYEYAGRPREFMREIIGSEWDSPDWTSWRAFISTVFCEPLQSIGEWRAFWNCTQLALPPDERPPSVWMPVGRRGGKSRMLAG